MAKNPSTTFYFNDWENDEKLKICSLAAQGLWMRLLCIAARSPEPGIVLIGRLTYSHPHGLTLIASAVGRPLEEIAPLIDELLASGTASLDRTGRIYCRRMVRAAKTSAARALSGRNGAAVTNGKRWGKEETGRQNVGKPPDKPVASSRLQDFESSSHKDSPDSAARATADPDGPPRTRLPDSAKWAERLAAYEPWNGKHRWNWGPPPDAVGARNPSLSDEQIRAWKARRDAALKAGSAA